jgi:hypothetical protein
MAAELPIFRFSATEEVKAKGKGPEARDPMNLFKNYRVIPMRECRLPPSLVPTYSGCP